MLSCQVSNQRAARVGLMLTGWGSGSFGNPAQLQGSKKKRKRKWNVCSFWQEETSPNLSITVSGELGKDGRWSALCVHIHGNVCVCVRAHAIVIAFSNNKHIFFFFECRNLGCHSVHMCVCVCLYSCLWVRGNRCPPSGCWDGTSHSTCVKWQWWTAGSPFNNSIYFNLLSSPSHFICLSVRSQITPLTRIWLHKLERENTDTFYIFPPLLAYFYILWRIPSFYLIFSELIINLTQAH